MVVQYEESDDLGSVYINIIFMILIIFECVYFRAADKQMYLLYLLNVCQFDA